MSAKQAKIRNIRVFQSRKNTKFETFVKKIGRSTKNSIHSQKSSFHQNLAKKTKHSTASQAAKIARLAQVKRLVLGHFSSRYSEKNDFLIEASSIFESVSLASDGKIFDI